jgi:hypothetical protein
VTDGITCYDACANDQYPSSLEAAAAYVDGSLGNEPNFSYIVAAFPRAQHLSIALNPEHEAIALDVENGAAPPSAVPAWHAAQAARGIVRPCVYASVWTMQAQVLPLLADADISLSATRLWTAHYGHGEHICGPASCGLLPVGADGTQWTDNALGRNLDQSLLLPGFFGQLPADWTYGPPLAVAATGGRQSVRLEWQPPQGYPELPVAYRIWIYRGTRADQSTLVPTYPRDAIGELSWQGGGLERGSVYCAHVSAMGVDGERMRPYGYSAALFKTG